MEHEFANQYMPGPGFADESNKRKKNQLHATKNQRRKVCKLIGSGENFSSIKITDADGKKTITIPSNHVLQSLRSGEMTTLPYWMRNPGRKSLKKDLQAHLDQQQQQSQHKGTVKKKDTLSDNTTIVITNRVSYALQDEQKEAISQNDPENLENSSEEGKFHKLKSELIDLLFGETDIGEFCRKVCKFLCLKTEAVLCGIYLLSTITGDQCTTELNLVLVEALPSITDFKNVFHPFPIMLRHPLENGDILSWKEPMSEFRFSVFPLRNKQQSLGLIVIGDQEPTPSETMGTIVGEIIKVAYTPLNLLQLESQNLNMKMHLTKLEEENRQMKVKDISDNNNVAESLHMESEGVALMCTTETGIITYMSPKLQEMLGFHFTEIVGLYTPLIFLSPAEVEMKKKFIEVEEGKAVSEMQVWCGAASKGVLELSEWTLITKQRTTISAIVQVEPLIDPRFSIPGYVVTIYNNPSHLP